MTKPYTNILLFLTLLAAANSATLSTDKSAFTSFIKHKLLGVPAMLKVDAGCTTEPFHKLFPDGTDKYIIEEHETTTSDGYILRLFRVNLSPAYKAKLQSKWTKNQDKVILIVHGLTDSSDSWFYNGEDTSIGFKLVNQGYDVWLGNNRGNKYSHRHTNPNISDGDFFTFSWDEMGLYDAPAFYKTVLAESKKDKLIYFGHSEGTSQMFVAGLDDTTRDYITAHTEKFIALAPVIFLDHCGSTVIDLTAKLNGLMYPVSQMFGIHEIAPAFCDVDHNKIWTEVVQFACNTVKIMCDNVVPGFNFNEKVDNALDDVDRLTQHFPGGSSIKAMAKYAQAMDYKTWGPAKKFQRFDYGGPGNLLNYGSWSPPAWDVTKWAIPTVLVVGTRDEFGTVEDNAAFASVVGDKLTTTYFMDNWDHYTFCFARDPKPLFDVMDKELEN